MIVVTINHVTIDQALKFKQQLKDAGLVMDHDYEWAFYRAEYDNFSYNAVSPRRVEFRFQDAKLATFYQLMWAQ